LKHPLDILENYWGYTSFRPMQEEIIQSVLDGKDTIALLPTGGGKSICFQIPAVAQEGICIVISPLVALMNDQVNQLTAKGIKALSITGGISFTELRTLLDNAMYGNYKFLYLSPERLQQEVVQNAIREMAVNLIAVDEAHCISQWGNDFRPSYKNITVLRELHPLVPFIALTATATPEVLEDTITQLKLELPNVFKDSFIRPNLAYRVVKEDDKLYRIEQLLKQNTGTAIIYVRSRKSAVENSNHLNSLGITSTFYHGGVSKSDKEKRFSQWQNGTVSTMVATNAFGMGIDQSNVRFVIHIQLPESLEGYFQEAGRAGRDGGFAQAIILYNEYDKILVKKQFVESLANPTDLKYFYKKLNTYFQIPYGEGAFSTHSFNFSEFCQVYKLNTLKAYNGLNAMDRLGIIQLSKEFGQKSILQFTVSTNALLAYFEKNIQASVIGKTILRIYGGIFESPTEVNLDFVSKKTGQSIADIISVLKKMERDELLDLTLRVTDATVTFLVPREDDKTINIIAKEIKQSNRKKELQVGAVLTYIENTKICRSQQLVSYFGETTAKPCGICSVCASQKKLASRKEVTVISEKILILLEEQSLSSKQLTERTTFSEAKMIHVLRLLMDAQKISLNTKNEYTLK